ncbi:MAG: hypothetical protein WBZ36_08375 [Candidatus Nitrosopolaris sp.]
MTLKIEFKRASGRLFAILVPDGRDDLMIEHFLMFNNVLLTN